MLFPYHEREISAYARAIARSGRPIEPSLSPGTDVSLVSALSRPEQISLLTLWLISRSPLMMGGDLPTSPPETIELLTNDETLDVLWHSGDNREVLREKDLVLWTAREHRQRYPLRRRVLPCRQPQAGHRAARLHRCPQGRPRPGTVNPHRHDSRRPMPAGRPPRTRRGPLPPRTCEAGLTQG